MKNKTNTVKTVKCDRCNNIIIDDKHNVSYIRFKSYNAGADTFPSTIMCYQCYSKFWKSAYHDMYVELINSGRYELGYKLLKYHIDEDR